MAYDDYRLLHVATDGGICRATIATPPINLVGVPLITEIGRLTLEVSSDHEVRVLIVDSADPAFFIAHADVELIAALPTNDISLHGELSPFHSLTEQFRALPQATI